ncbi:MAG: PTS glucose transporter subunit IIA [Erysipelotrichaceae bacterium]|nr:PTS glucose transporter subunit IIA [Erysipelotrichaceae bacterium]
MLGFFKKRRLPELAAVISGNCIPLEEVKDEVFASKAMGDGVAIVPENNEVVAPCDGNLSLVANTGHAFGMVSSDGTEILIHIGIDTVNLNGKGFTVLAKQGEEVKKGQAIIRFDPGIMKENNLDMTTMMIILSKDVMIETYNTGSKLKKGQDAAIVYRKG